MLEYSADDFFLNPHLGSKHKCSSTALLHFFFEDVTRAAFLGSSLRNIHPQPQPSHGALTECLGLCRAVAHAYSLSALLPRYHQLRMVLTHYPRGVVMGIVAAPTEGGW